MDEDDTLGPASRVFPVIRAVRIFCVALVLSLVGIRCSPVQSVTRTLSQVALPGFRLVGVSDVQLGGISLHNLRSAADLTVEQVLQLQQLLQQQTLPLVFTVHLQVVNVPESAALRNVPITIRQIRWQLLIDQQPTVAGTVTQPVRVPAGQSMVIPIQVNVDLVRFFRNKQYQQFLDLALQLARGEGLHRIALEIQPTLEIPIVGTYRYPQPIRVDATRIRR